MLTAVKGNGIENPKKKKKKKKKLIKVLPVI